MNEKRLTRMIYIVSFLALIMIIAFAFCGMQFKHDVTDLKQNVNDLRKIVEGVVSKPTVNSIPPKDGYTPIKGVDYVDGAPGANGKDGRDGKDSVSTHTIETIIKEKPVKGDQGPPIDVYVDPTSCLFMTKTHTDTSWTIQAQLPKPCEVLQ